MLLKVENISKSYGDITALKDVSVNINKGELLGIIGRNGAGKSTLIKCIVDILEPDEGNILWNNSLNPQKAISIGYLPEERGLYLNATVYEQLEYYALLNGMSKDDFQKNVNVLLTEFQIEEYSKRPIKTLSKGNKQKVQLMTALIHNPEFIFLDEPFSGLDPVNIRFFKDYIKKISRLGKTLIISSHRISDVEELCDRVIMINKGTVIVDEHVDKIINANCDKYRYFIRCNDNRIQNALELNNIAYSSANDGYEIILEREDEIYNLQKIFVDTGIKVDEMVRQKQTLEDIFIKGLDYE